MTKLNLNPMLRMDSYKTSHPFQYPPSATNIRSYIESRGGNYDETVFFGLQAYIKENLLDPIDKGMVNDAAELYAMHGVPFHKEGWMRVVNKWGGFLPIEIEAVAEGTVMAPKNVQAQVVNTDDELPWITSNTETGLLRAIWYPSTVATISRKMKQYIYEGLIISADDPDAEIGFKLHDFGARGASSSETAGLGGMAHLINFMGTDTVEGVLAARAYYGEDMAGFSIPATEHSTVTSWGRDGESAMVGSLLRNNPTGLLANVGDSYDMFSHVRNILGRDHKATIMERDGVYVIRPDSGDPLTMPLDVIEVAMEVFGEYANKKGYRVLPDQVRVIQGDGMDENSIPQLIKNALERRISISNFAMGMGGGLLQKLDRDTLKYAMKANEIKIDGVWKDVYKDPITDAGKRSKRGRQALIKVDGVYNTVPYNQRPKGAHGLAENFLRPVFRNGELLVDASFADIRSRAALV